MSLLPDELNKWSGASSDDSGAEPFDSGPCLDPQAHMMQAILGQKGPTLYATSGVCLLIPIFVMQSQIGVVVHLARESSLSPEAVELIKKPIIAYPSLQDSPSVGFVSSELVRDEYGEQLAKARELILKLVPSAVFRDIIVGSGNGDQESPMNVEIELDTANATLLVLDEYADWQSINYADNS